MSTPQDPPRPPRPVRWIGVLVLVLGLAAGAWALFGPRPGEPSGGNGGPGPGPGGTMPHLPESDPKLPPGALSPKIGPLTPSETPKQEMARLEQILLDPRYTVDDRVGAIGRLYDLDKTKEHYSVFLADMIGSARSPEMVDGLAPLAEKYPNPVVIDRFMGGFLAIENIEMRRAFLRALRPHIKQRKDIFEQLQGWSGETSPELKQEWEEAIREGRAAFGGADGGR